MQAGANLRSQSRANVFLSASMVVGTASLPVRVRNLSARGAFIDGGSLPPPGEAVRLVRGSLSADGEIAWAADGHAGVRFAGEIDVAEWVKRVGHVGQQRVDEAVVSIRRNEAPAPVRPLPSLDWIAAELEFHLRAPRGLVRADGRARRGAGSPRFPRSNPPANIEIRLSVSPHRLAVPTTQSGCPPGRGSGRSGRCRDGPSPCPSAPRFPRSSVARSIAPGRAPAG